MLHSLHKKVGKNTQNQKPTKHRCEYIFNISSQQHFFQFVFQLGWDYIHEWPINMVDKAVYYFHSKQYLSLPNRH